MKAILQREEIEPTRDELRTYEQLLRSETLFQHREMELKLSTLETEVMDLVKAYEAVCTTIANTYVDRGC